MDDVVCLPPSTTASFHLLGPQKNYKYNFLKYVYKLLNYISYIASTIKIALILEKYAIIFYIFISKNDSYSVTRSEP